MHLVKHPDAFARGLNRCSGVRKVALATKGNRQITERGRPYPGNRCGFARSHRKTCPARGSKDQGRRFLPLPEGRASTPRFGEYPERVTTDLRVLPAYGVVVLL